MMWKKSFVNVMLWVVFFMMISAALIFMIYSAVMEKDPEAHVIAMGLPTGMIVGVFLLFFLFRLIVARLPLRRLFGKKEVPYVVEGVLFVAMITAGLALRIWNLNFASENTAYFEIAKVTENSSIPQIAHGATFFYTLLLRILFLVAGNHWIAGIWLQIVLQILSAVLLYFAIRKLSGAVAGIISLSLMMLLQGEVMRGLRYSPDMLYLCLYAVGLLLLASLVNRLTLDEKSWVRVVLLLITGVWTGFLGYLDVTGLTLCVVAFCALGVHGSRLGKSLIYVTSLVMVAVISFFGFVWLDAFSCGKDFADILNAWMEIYRVKSHNMWFWYVKDDFVMWIAILGFLIFGSIGFWVSGRLQRFTPWILLLGSVFLIGYLHMDVQNMDTMTLLFTVCYTLIGVGISEGMCSFFVSGCEGYEMSRDLSDELSVDLAYVTDGASSAGELIREEIPAPEIHLRTPVMIQNPLPVPKKHVRKVQDYSIQPDEDTMYFDFEISEDDDFDL